jgi:4-amino-4-deoxychorismate lyase
MSHLFETIACRQGKLQNLEWHNARLNNSRRKLFNNNNQIFLEQIHLPEFVKKGNWKCKVLYSDIINGISFEPYVPREIKSLTLVESSINYAFKSDDRDELDSLYRQKKEADDIIIIKDGFVTDSSIANILLFNGQYWVTPDTPLLAGTMRAQLIHKGIIKEASVKESQLGNYKELMLINAMNSFDSKRAVNISSASIM